MITERATCPVCDGNTTVVTTAQPGYQQPAKYSIVQCERCGTAHAQPLASSSAVYELIYSQAAMVPGYERYARFARGVERATDPLAYIGAQEDVYWSVWRYLCDRNPETTGPILEVGCGLGYLTYAMRRRGFAATGIDLSTEAIARARKRYGPYYEAYDVAALADSGGTRYDLVVMTEVIEHLPDFYPVMRSIVALLSDRGEALITTPNRSAYGKNLVWETDPPPVHLWWFTEDAMREIARRLDVDVRFMDFAPLNATTAALLPKLDAEGVTRGAMFDERGKLLGATAALRRFVPVGRIYEVIANGKARRLARERNHNGAPDPQNGRRGTLCAIFSKRNSA